jgi:hypothetical protein
MLPDLRRNRWMIALLLLALGPVGVLSASTAATCPGSEDAGPERVAAVAGSWLVGEFVAAGERHVAEGNQQPPATETPSAHPSVPGCGGYSLPIERANPPAQSLEVRPLAEPDTTLPRLSTHTFFRPPQNEPSAVS